MKAIPIGNRSLNMCLGSLAVMWRLLIFRMGCDIFQGAGNQNGNLRDITSDRLIAVFIGGVWELHLLALGRGPGCASSGVHASYTFLVSWNSILSLVSVPVGTVRIDILLTLNRSSEFALLLLVAGRVFMVLGLPKVALRVIKSGSGSDCGQGQGKDLSKDVTNLLDTGRMKWKSNLPRASCWDMFKFGSQFGHWYQLMAKTIHLYSGHYWILIQQIICLQTCYAFGIEVSLFLLSCPMNWWSTLNSR